MPQVIVAGRDPAVLARIRQLDFTVANHTTGQPVPPLDSASASQVWVIPEAVFRSEEWSRLRVDLARAPRFFIVQFQTLQTRDAVAAMRDGAFDILVDADDTDRWAVSLRKAAEGQRLWLDLYAGQLAGEGDRLVGVSPAMKDLRRDLERLGPTDVTVLLLGESGVGKERVACALHEVGRGGPLVTLNCAAMPRELIEAELFGSEKGAFTGAVRSRPGLVEQAAGGTLFLDEVGELDLSLQPKLLRFLETRRARRVGGDAEYSVRLRVVAATNRDLEQEVSEGRFRADLFYRLAEVVVRIPPLRERKEDIASLVRSFVAAAAERFGKQFDAVEPELILRFQQYSWPGNVRELKSAVDRLVLFHEGPILRSGWWTPNTTVQARPVSAGGAVSRPPEMPSISDLPNRGARMDLARRLLAEGRMSLSEIAARAGVHPTTLFRWRKAGKTADETAPGV